MKKRWLENDLIRLRALEPEDLDVLFSIENNSELWDISNTLVPYSRHLLEKYLKNVHQDLFEARQLRLAIVRKHDEQFVGLIDLFEFDPQHSRAGIGILIQEAYQKNGYAYTSLKTFINYVFQKLDIHQLYANIPVDNSKSVRLFERLNFSRTGTNKEWIKVNGRYLDVFMYQVINPNHT